MKHINSHLHNGTSGSNPVPYILSVLTLPLVFVLSFGQPSVAAEPAEVRPGVLLLECFTTGSSFPQDWGVRESSEWPAALRTYWVVPGEAPFLRAVHEGQGGNPAVQIIKPVTWDIHKYPILRWTWRAHQLPPDGSELRGSKTNDSAASLYVIYKLRNYIVTKLPTAVKYLWSTTVPKETIIPGRYDSFKMRVVESGTDHLSQWQTVEVDVFEDYRRLFGGRPDREAIAIALLTDADATRAIAAADYGPIYALTREAAAALADSAAHADSTAHADSVDSVAQSSLLPTGR